MVHSTSGGKPQYKNAPNNWGTDPLTSFLDDALWNTFATFSNERSWYAAILETDHILQTAASNLNDPDDVIPAFLLVRCHAMFRAAARLVLATQVPESYPLMRACLELSGYGVLVHSSPAIAEVWMHRDDSKTDHSAARNTLTWGKVLEAIRATDNSGKLASPFSDLYERCLTFGAHPNAMAIFSNMEMRENPNDADIWSFNLKYLTPEPDVLRLALKTLVQVGFASLRAHQLVFPARFMLLGLDHRLDVLGLSEI